MRLLIIDDDPGIRRLITAVVTSFRAEIVECTDGAAALAEYERHRPDVVLMDIAMPQLDGLAATTALTARYPGARVIIVTMHDEPALRAAAAVAGAQGYVLKENLLELLPLLSVLSR